MVQSAPSQVHVPPPTADNTTRSRPGSEAIAAPASAGGEVAGVSRLQSAPSQAHVSPSCPNPFSPPNSRSRFDTGSNAMAASLRTDGAVGGDTDVHVEPSQVQVSPK